MAILGLVHKQVAVKIGGSWNVDGELWPVAWLWQGTLVMISDRHARIANLMSPTLLRYHLILCSRVRNSSKFPNTLTAVYNRVTWNITPGGSTVQHNYLRTVVNSIKLEQVDKIQVRTPETLFDRCDVSRHAKSSLCSRHGVQTSTPFTRDASNSILKSCSEFMICMRNWSNEGPLINDCSSYMEAATGVLLINLIQRCSTWSLQRHEQNLKYSQ